MQASLVAQFRPLAEMAAKDDAMYGRLCLHLEHLYRHYKSGGTAPLKGLPPVLPEVADDQARLKAACGEIERSG